MSGRDKVESISELLNEIERRFHLVQDASSADLVYRLREKVGKLKWSHHELAIENTKLKKLLM